jgi:predicted transcriptional regulator
MLSVMKTDERRRARELRADGRSVREIAEMLGVAQASASVWVRDIPITAEQRRALDERGERGRALACLRKAETARAVRRSHQQTGRRLARERDGSYAAGCMLYWAEGGKTRNAVRLTNADPEVLVFFARFLRAHFDVRSDEMTIYCNLFADHQSRQRQIEQYWLTRLALPSSSLRKSVVNVYSKYSKKKRINRLPYGTCRLVVHSTRIVQTIYGSIQEYGGFDRPEWLD